MIGFDMVITNNNESELIDMAVNLGYTELILLTDNLNYKYLHTSTITIKTAFLLKEISQIHKARKNFNYLVANADRKFFESKIDFIINSELSERRDSFHYRNTSLNQVHAKLAKEKNIHIVFNFNLLLNSSGRLRQMHLGRMFQNAHITKKYKINSRVFSLARNPAEMRSRNSFDALEKVLNL